MEHPFITRLRNHPVTPLFLVIGSVFGSFAANLYGLLAGITIVIPHLFYIPIILAAFFYPRRGVGVAALISACYFLMVAAFGPDFPSDLISAGARCIVFVIIAAVVSYLSGRLGERERAVRTAKEEWERTFDAVPDLISLIDRNYRVIRINRAMAQNTGISPEQAIGKHCYELVHHSERPPPVCPHAMLLQDGIEHSGEVHEPHLGGDFLVTASPLFDADGSLIGSVHVARNITDRLQAQQAILSANNKLNILSSVTRHDILNQITALLAYLELSKEITRDPVLLEYISKEIQTIDAIQRQIEFTRYYQDIGVKAPEWQDLKTTIRNAAAQLPMEAIALEVNSGEVEIYADSLLEKVFYNLIENAIRHGDRVTAITFTSRESADGLIVTYEDNGTGVAPENKEKIFLRGFGKHTGLGLFLIREILSITGITIGENGVYGNGARFEIRVPRGKYRGHGFP